MLTFRLPEPALLVVAPWLRWVMAVALLRLLNNDVPNSPLASRPWPNWVLIAPVTTIAVRPRSFMAGASTSSR